MTFETWYLCRQYDHTLQAWASRPIIHPIDGTKNEERPEGILALYPQPGDRGKQEVCKTLADKWWPGVADSLRPLEWKEVPMPTGPFI